MATRRDVARLAGTSEAVVSYVLNDGPRGVAPATRERVLAAIAELDYRPNAVARSLRTRRTMTFGLVVPDNSNPFFAEMARAVEDVGFEYGYTMLLGNAMDDDEREAAYVRTLLDRQVDGLLLVPAHGTTTMSGELAQGSTPWLVLDREIAAPEVPQILVDHFGGARTATAHLLEHGHERVACLAGVANLHPTVDRVGGWQQALRDADIDPDAMPLAYAAFGRADGYRAGLRLLGGDDPPSALFVTSDEQAMGVLRAAAELGIKVPDDLAICSFDGIEASAFTVPGLSTIRQPVEAVCRMAVEWLVARIGNPEHPATREVLPPALIRRGSCGCPDAVPEERGDGPA